MKANVLIDWFSFTFKCKGYESHHTHEKHSSSMVDVQYVIEHILKLPFDCFQSALKSRYGYRDSLVYNGIEIHHNGNSLDMGVNVSMSGNACRVYEQHHSMMDLVKCVYEAEDVRATRIDLACDDKTGVLDVSFIIGEIRNCRLRTSIKRKRGIFDLEGKKDGANTVYIGSEKSSMRFRIYDKAKEQGDYDGIWNRIEGVFRKEHANSVIKLLVTSGKELGECVAEIFNDKIQFINLDDSNITRCSVADWWHDFIETVKRLRLSLPEAPVSSVDRLYSYFENLGACFYVLSEALGEKVWEGIYSYGKGKAKQRHRQMINDYRGLSMA